MTEQRFLRLPELLDRVALSRSEVYARIARDEFPRPLLLSPRRAVWAETEVDAWMASQVANAPRQHIATTE